MQPADGRWNRRIGWALLIAGFAWAAWLDPWSLSEHDPARVAGSARMIARHGQAVVLAMAFLQLLTAELLASAGPAVRRVVAALTAVARSCTRPATSWNPGGRKPSGWFLLGRC